jgi:hypothetical protein
MSEETKNTGINEDSEAVGVDTFVMRQQIWEKVRTHQMIKLVKPEYLILSSSMYNELRTECEQQVGNYAKDLEIMNKYMGLTVAVIPKTYGVDIIEVAV